MEEKKFQSIVRRVVLVPMMVMAAIVCITVISGAISFFNMRQQMIDSNISSLQISQNQLENLLGQIDNAFLQYWNNNESYRYMKNFEASTPGEKRVVYEAATHTWVNDLVKSHDEIQGAFAYFDNLDELIFRGNSNFAVHAYIKNRLEQEEEGYNRWELATIGRKRYLIVLKRIPNFCGGVWIPIEALKETLGWEEEGYRGTIYLMDYHNQNTLPAGGGYEELLEQGEACETVELAGEVFYNYTVFGEEDVFLGILVPRKKLFSGMPMVNKGMFVLAILSVLLIPVLVKWLQSRIAYPVRDIDKAMQMIGEGNMDYRITLPEKHVYDEFDRLMVRFNQTMDELNDLEFNLYKTKIREQRTELKYISQQIRPHFILNALNIIYTCEESEFPLVKKMVLYLTEYFRYIVNLRRDFVEVEQELHHVENYLNIQKERYLDRFEFFVEWEIAAKNMLIPPLIIQTFVENCIKYAIKSQDTTFIYVLASVEEQRLRLMIADTGNGFSEEILEKINLFLQTREHQEGLGVGIENAIERMDILYEDLVEVKVRNALSGGAVVEIYLPIKMED